MIDREIWMTIQNYLARSNKYHLFVVFGLRQSLFESTIYFTQGKHHYCNKKGAMENFEVDCGFKQRLPQTKDHKQVIFVTSR
jgi:hypothetical protein